MNANHEEETIARVEAMGEVAAVLMDVMKNQALAHEYLSWTDMISAAAIACRGVAAIAMAGDPELTLDVARAKMSRRFMQVMMLPPELVQIHKAEEGEDSQVIVIPVRKQ